MRKRLIKDSLMMLSHTVSSGVIETRPLKVITSAEVFPKYYLYT